ncbi:MAG: AAA family ATPase [Nitrospinaceae bacterium]|nr:AAA family ATPase [Nitrospinaceae bacterium]
MEGRYHKRMISEYLENLIGSIGSSSPAADAVAEWVAQYGGVIGIDLNDDDFVGSENRRRRVRQRHSKVSRETWNQLVSAVSAARKQFSAARPSVFDRNLNSLGMYFSLDATETRILDIVCRYRSRNSFTHLCEKFLETESHDTTGLIALLLHTARDKVSRRIKLDRPLFKYGLLVRERNLSQDEMFLNVPDRLLESLNPPNRNFDDICRTLIGKPAETELAWEDFDHVAEERNFVADILNGALREDATGMNFLLYGPPGTGKTEFCKMIAARLGVTLYCIGDQDDEGNEPSRFERLTQVKLSQQLLAARKNTFILFDEMEDLLGGGGNTFKFIFGKLSRGAPGSKAFVNRLLEENTVPTFWTCNDIEGFDPATLRRMTAAIELKTPSAPIRERVWHRILQSEGVKLPQEEITRLAREFEEAPALAANAVKAAKLAGGGIERIRLAVRSVGKAVRGGRELAPKELTTAPYLEELINADTDLQRLTARLAETGAPRNFSLCLYGPPGTGKSAFVRFMAEQLGLEVLIKRGSDLLSCWVGETEKLIAQAFSEARTSKSFLIIDEADSLLQDRSGAHQSWEITQTNEMLTWMEVHDQPFACTTNLMERLDRASLRRFTFKCKFDYLSSSQNAAAFEHFFGHPAPTELRELIALTPGDFAVVAKKAHILSPGPEELVVMLRQEFEVKPNVPRPIGFAMHGTG